MSKGGRKEEKVWRGNKQKEEKKNPFSSSVMYPLVSIACYVMCPCSIPAK